MKKFEHLGKSLSKSEQKKIIGGYDDMGQCLAWWFACRDGGACAVDCRGVRTVGSCASNTHGCFCAVAC